MLKNHLGAVGKAPGIQTQILIKVAFYTYKSRLIRDVRKQADFGLRFVSGNKQELRAIGVGDTSARSLWMAFTESCRGAPVARQVQQPNRGVLGIAAVQNELRTRPRQSSEPKARRTSKY
ncbi:hypothetical protein QUB68_01965 [Microcoleus sp. A006_D1]|uniref:hypothetical protein n=1 Tax=Microcoleus sp. A006_D1 TaxID=3055267 RepID=UPI002FD0D250